MAYDVVLSSAAAKAQDEPGVTGYFYNHGGLNNQKMALIGLLMFSCLKQLPINLPYIYVKDQSTDLEYLGRFADVFELDPILSFAERNGIVVNHACPSGERGGWDLFRLFGELTADTIDPKVVATLLDALASLTPRIIAAPVFLHLKNFLFASLGIQTAIQLRIERDWQQHAQNLRSVIGDSEDYGIGFSEILAKVKNSFPDLRLAYVMSDENAMPTTKQEIRTFVRDRFGIDLLWKSDLLTADQLRPLNPLDLSLIDFEIARRCQRFIGLTQSTFANILCMEKFARTRKHVTGQFIYNYPGEHVMERRDDGFTTSAGRAIQPHRLGEVLARP